MYHGDLLRLLWINLLPFLRLLEGLYLSSSGAKLTHTVAYLKAAGLIVIAYATLLVINTRYISLAIVPILMLVFIGALFVDISLDEDDRNNEDKQGRLFATAILPCALLCWMGKFNVENLVISQFLLFLTSTLGELTLMMARLPARVAPAFEVSRRASLVVAVVTAHAMAAELLGDDAVLVCTLELIAALLWLCIHMNHGDGDSSAAIAATVRKATSPQAFIVVLGALLVVLNLQYYQASSSTGEPGEPAGVILLSWYMWALVACAFSAVLPSLCIFALREWPGQTLANPFFSRLEAAQQPPGASPGDRTQAAGVRGSPRSHPDSTPSLMSPLSAEVATRVKRRPVAWLQTFNVVLGTFALKLQYYQASSSTGEPGEEPPGGDRTQAAGVRGSPTNHPDSTPSLTGLDGAVLLLSFCRDVFIAAFLIILVATPLVDARLGSQVLGSQVQGLVANKWSKSLSRLVHVDN